MTLLYGESTTFMTDYFDKAVAGTAAGAYTRQLITST